MPDADTIAPMNMNIGNDVSVKVVCIQYVGQASAPRPIVRYTRDEALALARKVVAHARLAGADMDALARQWSDLPPAVTALKKEQTDPHFAPAFVLHKGQVSDAITQRRCNPRQVAAVTVHVVIEDRGRRFLH